VGLERGPLSLVRTTEEVLGRKRSGSGLDRRDYCRENPLCPLHDTLCPQKLTLTSPTSGGRSVGIVRSQSQAMEFSFILTPNVNLLSSFCWLLTSTLKKEAVYSSEMSLNVYQTTTAARNTDTLPVFAGVPLQLSRFVPRQLQNEVCAASLPTLQEN
jgi:hypothetical protein